MNDKKDTSLEIESFSQKNIYNEKEKYSNSKDVCLNGMSSEEGMSKRPSLERSEFLLENREVLYSHDEKRPLSVHSDLGQQIPMSTISSPHEKPMKRPVSQSWTPMSLQNQHRLSKIKNLLAEKQNTEASRAHPSASGTSRTIGTQIDEKHQNFALMYDMLMGIRTTVSRCNAKINRELNLEDFKARHKLAFDV
jgi:hypothetical protein